MNLATLIESLLKALAAKALPNLSTDDQAIVDAAIVANVNLLLLLVKKEGLRLLAKDHPQIAAAILPLIGTAA